MQGDDIADGEKLIQRNIGNSFYLLNRSTVSVYFTPESPGNLCRAQSDGPGAHNAEFFALQFKTNQAVFCPFVPDGCIAGDDISVQGDNHAKYEVSHGDSGISCAVADGYAVLPACIHGDVIHAGEGNGEKLQVFAALDYFAVHGKVGDNNDVGIFSALNQLLCSGYTGVVVYGFQILRKRLLCH